LQEQQTCRPRLAKAIDIAPGRQGSMSGREILQAGDRGLAKGRTAAKGIRFMRWFHALMPKEDQFVELFCRHARTLVEGAESLRLLLEEGQDVPKHCADIARFEDEADAIARETLHAVRQTFITPFDRGDIKDLASLLDDAIDQMQKTAKTISLYEFRDFEPQMREMADTIVRAAELTLEAMPLMANLRANAPRLHALAEEISKVEEQSDEIYSRGIKALYLARRDAGDPFGYLVGYEIYDHLEKVVDRFEDMANRVSGIVIENI
jgi:predicted phosphate transport protein (TIGR00153 family)